MSKLIVFFFSTRFAYFECVLRFVHKNAHLRQHAVTMPTNECSPGGLTALLRDVLYILFIQSVRFLNNSSGDTTDTSHLKINTLAYRPIMGYLILYGAPAMSSSVSRCATIPGASRLHIGLISRIRFDAMETQ